MSCLNIHVKLRMMLDALNTTKDMLNDDTIRPATKAKLEEDMIILKRDIKGLYFDLFNVEIDDYENEE